MLNRDRAARLALGSSVAVLLALPTAAAAAASGPAPSAVTTQPPAAAGGSVPPKVVVPPIAEQQIPTASQPMEPLSPAPIITTASAPLPFGGSGSSSAEGVSSVSDLDRGAALWTYIMPNYDPSYGGTPMTEVYPLAGTTHAEPLPEATEVPLAENLDLEIRVPIGHRGVPGIDPVTSGSGNRALWFETR